MKIETKFNIGDRVFYMSNNEVRDNTISGIIINISEKAKSIRYTMPNSLCYYEEKCFSTKEELIKSL